MHAVRVRQLAPRDRAEARGVVVGGRIRGTLGEAVSLGKGALWRACRRHIVGGEGNAAAVRLDQRVLADEGRAVPPRVDDALEVVGPLGRVVLEDRG